MQIEIFYLSNTCPTQRMIYYCRWSDPIRATTTLATRPPSKLLPFGKERAN